MENITELLKGILEGCVLEIISRGETYGYEITQQLRQLGFSDVVEGTVYTITMRLEAAARSYRKKSINNGTSSKILYAKRSRTRSFTYLLGKMGVYLTKCKNCSS